MNKSNNSDHNPLREQIKSESRLSEKNAVTISFKEKKYNTLDEAKEAHYREIGKVLTDELKQKMKLRQWTVWFMLIFVSLNFIISICILICVICSRVKTGNEVVSDKFLLTFLISPLVNFLTSLGIIFKYLFSQTSETYDYLKTFIRNPG